MKSKPKNQSRAKNKVSANNYLELQANMSNLEFHKNIRLKPYNYPPSYRTVSFRDPCSLRLRVWLELCPEWLDGMKPVGGMR
jgi:hypothetical protein